MATVVTVTYKRRNKSFFDNKENQVSAYSSSAAEQPYVDKIVPRAGKETVVQGENTITFGTAFPVGTSYLLWTYTYDDNNYQVGSYIIEESDGSDGTYESFTIYVSKGCNLKYIATPIK